MPETIETDRLRLRPFRAEDAPALHEQIYGDADVMLSLPGRIPRSLERTESLLEFFAEHWAEYSYGAWAVEDKATGALIGQVGVQQLADHTGVELFYAFGKGHWGQGIATEAARAALRYAFDEADLRRVVGLVADDNAASERVLQKLGMGYESRVKYYNMKLKRYAILSGDFDPGDGFFTIYEDES